MKKAAPFTKELKQKWIEALKSGKYKQGFGRLYDPQAKAHCCLGVLADIHPDLNSPNTVDDEVGGEVYHYLEENNIDQQKLWEKNDDHVYVEKVKKGKQKCDYSNVIPLIKKLPTMD